MFVIFGADALATTATEQALLPGGNWTNAPQNKNVANFVVSVPCRVQNMFARSRTTGAGSGTVAINVWIDGALSGIGTVVSQASNLESEDTVNTAIIGAGGTIAVTMTPSAGATTAWEEPSVTVELIPI